MDIFYYIEHSVISLRTIEEGNILETRRSEEIRFLLYESGMLGSTM